MSLTSMSSVSMSFNLWVSGACLSYGGLAHTGLGLPGFLGSERLGFPLLTDFRVGSHINLLSDTLLVSAEVEKTVWNGAGQPLASLWCLLGIPLKQAEYIFKRVFILLIWNREGEGGQGETKCLLSAGSCLKYLQQLGLSQESGAQSRPSTWWQGSCLD